MSQILNGQARTVNERESSRFLTLKAEFATLSAASKAIMAHAETLACLYDDDAFTDRAEALVRLIHKKMNENLVERAKIVSKSFKS